MIEAGLRVLPGGSWLQQLKILDLSGNRFLRIPPVLAQCKGTLCKLRLYRAVRLVPIAASSHEDSDGDCNSEHDTETSHTSADSHEESNLTPDEVEYRAANNGDAAFSVAACRAFYQELLDASIDVGIDQAVLVGYESC